MHFTTCELVFLASYSWTFFVLCKHSCTIVEETVMRGRREMERASGSDALPQLPVSVACDLMHNIKHTEKEWWGKTRETQGQAVLLFHHVASSKQGQRADMRAILTGEDNDEDKYDISVQRIEEVMIHVLVSLCVHGSVWVNGCLGGWVCKQLIYSALQGNIAILVW